MAAIYTSTHEGQTDTRKSAGHLEQEYFFAIWAKLVRNGEWSCEAYTSRPDLAQARAAEYRRSSWFADVAIVPVTCVIKLTKRQQEFVATNPVWIAKRAAQAQQ
jgi:hypothetical protein